MRVFVTGATGFIGTMVVRELTAHGHQVLGLARNDASAKALSLAGVEAVRGDLADPASLARAARNADGVIHLAFIHDFSKYEEANASDRAAISAMFEALEGTNKPFVGTSGSLMVGGLGRPGTEDDVGNHGPRAQAEQMVVDGAKRGIRSSVVRLPPTVHGEGDKAFVPALIDLARRKGFAGYAGDGSNRWPAVHRIDAAKVFRLALEKGAPGTRFHASAEEGIPLKQIAETIAQALNVPVRALSDTEAPAYLEWLSRFAMTDNPTSTAKTREVLGWRPDQPGLLDDMRAHYFR